MNANKEAFDRSNLLFNEIVKRHLGNVVVCAAIFNDGNSLRLDRVIWHNNTDMVSLWGYPNPHSDTLICSMLPASSVRFLWAISGADEKWEGKTRLVESEEA